MEDVQLQLWPPLASSLITLLVMSLSFDPCLMSFLPSQYICSRIPPSALFHCWYCESSVWEWVCIINNGVGCMTALQGGTACDFCIFH